MGGGFLRSQPALAQRSFQSRPVGGLGSLREDSVRILAQTKGVQRALGQVTKPNLMGCIGAFKAMRPNCFERGHLRRLAGFKPGKVFQPRPEIRNEYDRPVSLFPGNQFAAFDCGVDRGSGTSGNLNGLGD